MALRENLPSRPDYHQFFWVVSGSLILCYGGAMAAVYSFRGRPSYVFAGFTLFALGYRLSQVGVHDLAERSLVRSLSSVDVGVRGLLRACGLGGAVALISYGGVVGAQAVLDPALASGALSGILITLGYVVGHIAINGSIV